MEKDDGSYKNLGCANCLEICSWLLVIICFPWSLYWCMKCAMQYERVIIYRMGRLHGKPRGPGIYFILPCFDIPVVVDLRLTTYDIPPQEILMKDSLSVTVDAVMFYRIFETVSSVSNIEDVHYGTRMVGQTMLRKVLGRQTLQELLANRERLCYELQVALDEHTEGWGVKVERVEIQEVKLPPQLQRSLASEAETAREAKARVISADGELKASKALTAAAEVISHSPGAIQLRYLQTLQAISTDQNEIYIFPMPMDLLREFFRSKQR